MRGSIPKARFVRACLSKEHPSYARMFFGGSSFCNLPVYTRPFHGLYFPKMFLVVKGVLQESAIMKEKEAMQVVSGPSSSEGFSSEINEVLREIPADKFALLRNQEDASILRRYQAKLAEITHSYEQIPLQYRRVLEAAVRTYIQNAKQIWETVRSANEDIDRGRRMEMEGRSKFSSAEKELASISEQRGPQKSRGFFGRRSHESDDRPVYMPVVERIHEALESIKEGASLQDNGRYRRDRAYSDFENILMELFSLVDEHRQEYWRKVREDVSQSHSVHREIGPKESVHRGNQKEIHQERVA